MADSPKVSVKPEEKVARPASALQPWRPFENLRREIDRLFEDFDRGVWNPFFRHSMLEPFGRRELTWGAAPRVDISESDKAYEIVVDLPGMDEKNIEVKVVIGIGGSLAAPPLPHHLAYGSVPRRFEKLR
jgi:HSP20 family protein